MSNEIQLGGRVKDRVSGFAGIATARTTFLNGCVRVCVDAEKVNKDGSVPSGLWFDEQQLELVQAAPPKMKPLQRAPEVRPGGPRSDARRRADAPRSR